MRAPGSMSVLVQVALLAAFAVLASQVVAFAVVLTAPPPRPTGFSVAAAAEALAGRPAETADGRALRRTLSASPPAQTAMTGPIERVIALGLAQRLGLSPETVFVRLNPNGPRRDLMLAGRGPPPLLRPLSPDGAPASEAYQSFVFGQGKETSAEPLDRDALLSGLNAAITRESPSAKSIESVQIITTGDRQTRFTVTADRLTFAPFSASARLPDGRWATVEPPRGWIDPWQARLLMALGITALLLAPVVWLMARRLTRPIRVFAQAAERLGADPDAEPLRPSGPSEVRTAIAAFNDMQASIRQHMRQRTQTIAAIAHDLRTPLTRLRFRAEQAPEALRDRMAADVEEMDGLIAQAMAFVRGEQPAARHEPLDIAGLAADCAAGFAETGADVEFEGTGPLPILGDAAALRRALGNLIDNAVKFAGSARVAATRAGDIAVIRVSDDGLGLPDAELERAFEPFHRGERSRNRQTGGAGLGLAVARQAARAAGGDVTLSNRPGGGLEARLSLPLSREASEAFPHPL